MSPAGIALVKHVVFWYLVQNSVSGECLENETEMKRLSEFPLSWALL